MIKVRGRPTAIGAGALTVVAVTAGVSLAGLPSESASAEPNPEVQARIIEDCDDPSLYYMGRSMLLPYPDCQVEPVEDLGPAWGEASKVWADGKNKLVPACETTARATKSEAHTTGTNFFVGFQVQVDKEMVNKIKPGIQLRFGWTFVNTRTSTYGQSFEIPPFHVGWYEVRPALRKVKVNITADYPPRGIQSVEYPTPGDQMVYPLKGVEMTTPDPETQDAWAGRTREMTPEELKTFCGLDEPPSGEPSPTPTATSSESPDEKKFVRETAAQATFVNVGTGRAADVDGGRSEVRSMPVNQADGQKWIIKRQPDGRVLLEPTIKPGWALGVNTDPRKYNQGIQPFALIDPDRGGADQRWRLIGAGGDAYTIVNQNGNCLTDPGNQGGTVGVFGCTGGDLQRWRSTGS